MLGSCRGVLQQVVLVESSGGGNINIARMVIMSGKGKIKPGDGG